MQPLKILGIYRHPMFSNNAIEADRLILERSLEELQRISPFPLSLEMAEESEAAKIKGRFSLVLTMAQDEKTLKILDQALVGSTVWNSQTAIRNCYRKTMSRILSGHPVNYVPYQLLSTDGSVAPQLDPKETYWLKRSDFHAIADEDVTLAESNQEVASKLERFRIRGVKEVILQRHIHGDIYKFYGVAGRLFRPIRVRNFLDSSSTPDFTSLEKSAEISANALGLKIFGGDAILDSEGKFHLIDLNDWPSFRLCRDDAAKAIAGLALTHLTATRASEKTPAAAVSLA